MKKDFGTGCGIFDSCGAVSCFSPKIPVETSWLFNISAERWKIYKKKNESKKTRYRIFAALSDRKRVGVRINVLCERRAQRVRVVRVGVVRVGVVRVGVDRVGVVRVTGRQSHGGRGQRTHQDVDDQHFQLLATRFSTRRTSCSKGCSSSVEMRVNGGRIYSRWPLANPDLNASA